MTLLDRHIEFLDALRAAGLPVSLSEGLDASAALGLVGWWDRQLVHDTYSATLVKKAAQQETFDALFELYFPRMVGSGSGAGARDADSEGTGKDGPEALEAFSAELVDALQADDADALRRLAAEAMVRFGAMPGRGPGLSSWSSYTAMRRLDPGEITQRLVEGLRGAGWGEEEAQRIAERRVAGYRTMVEDDSRRRIAEEKGPEHIAKIAVRPTIERLDFLHARRADMETLRRQIYPLARRLATRLTQEHHARRRGAVDLRRTLRASMSTGGVPVDVRHKPKRPHRTELVVLCDVSGSVASFATFTLMLVFALREQFAKVRTFMFVDDIVEVTEHFRPGADLVDVMTDVTRQAEHAALMGRTNYGRAFKLFQQRFGDALGPKSSLLVLGDARSNYADLELDVFKQMVESARHAWWLNPEVRMQWDVGDSEASRYGAIAPMVECRNLVQLEEFVGRLA
ncbi:MAG: VWA domain-containing protein [Nocardioides sp.]|nr:VWA domain-containing protein [Nocardioides sp.]